MSSVDAPRVALSQAVGLSSMKFCGLQQGVLVPQFIANLRGHGIPKARSSSQDALRPLWLALVSRQRPGVPVSMPGEVLVRHPLSHSPCIPGSKPEKYPRSSYISL